LSENPSGILGKTHQEHANSFVLGPAVINTHTLFFVSARTNTRHHHHKLITETGARLAHMRFGMRGRCSRRRRRQGGAPLPLVLADAIPEYHNFPVIAG